MQQNSSPIAKLKSLPTSVSAISIILRENSLYVDKTRYAYKMIEYTGKFFLSRPRRFGKSMLLSTFEEIFKGNKELFKEQWIYNSQWDWQEYPIIRLDFNVATTTDLMFHIKDSLMLVAKRYGVFDEKEYECSAYDTYFKHLILKLYAKFNEKGVVVLIDEYDKPILDVVENMELATEKREILKGFYTVMKGVDDQLRFVFLTGVSRFSKVGVFSGLNNLQDISMDNEYAAICGITQEELEFYCKDHIAVLANANDMTYEECLQKVREWYNGFCFSKKGISVYNPYSTMHVLTKKDFGNYWFSSGNASFIIKLMQQQTNFEVFKLDAYKAHAATFDTFELENLNIIAILFQSGYLTIKSYDKKSDTYILGYSNREIAKSFKENILTMFSLQSTAQANDLIMLCDAFNDNQLEEVIHLLKQIFLNIDYDIKISLEKHYQNIIYLLFQFLGYYINVEYKTNIGRADAIITTDKDIYIFEFKLDETALKAIEQIKQKSYYERFLPENKQIHLIGINFSSKTRNIDDHKIEEI